MMEIYVWLDKEYWLMAKNQGEIGWWQFMEGMISYQMSVELQDT